MDDVLIQRMLDKSLYTTPLRIDPDPEIRDALERYLDRNPRERHRHCAWLAATLWVYDYLPYKPSKLDVEIALLNLRRCSRRLESGRRCD